MKKILAIATAALFPALAGAATVNLSANTNGSITPGGTYYVTGTCSAGNGNASVSFSVVQGNTTTELPESTNLIADLNGNFSGNITFPSTNPTSGPATLTALCGGTGDIGTTIAFDFTSTAGTTGTNNSTSATPTNNSSGSISMPTDYSNTTGSSNNTDTSGNTYGQIDVLGDTTTPEGGVAAGNAGENSALGLTLAGILMIAGLVGFYVLQRNKLYA